MIKTLPWKKIISLGLSVFAVTISSAVLTGCEAGEEVPEQEELEQEEE